MRKTALITGAAGFLGRYLAPLLSKEYDVYGIDPKYKPGHVEYCSYVRGRFENYIGYNLFPDFDVIVHLAANILPIDKRMGMGSEAYQDIELDWAMAKCAEAHPPKKAFVYMSSCAVDTPEDPYAWIKLTGERVFTSIYKIGVPVVILRPFSGYGTDQDDAYPFSAILKRVLNEENPVKVWGSGYQVRDWIHVEDLVRGIVWAIEQAPRGIPIDIGTGVGTEMFALARMMIKLAFTDKEVLIEADLDKPESSRSRIAKHLIAQTYGFKAEISLEEGVRMAIEESRGKNDLSATA